MRSKLETTYYSGKLCFPSLNFSSLEQTKQCYLWPECPENILIEHKIINSHNQNRIRRKENKANPLPDTGVDIIQINDDNTLSFVQCKNGYKNGLSIQNFAGYFYWLLAFPSVNGYIYYTSKLCSNLTAHNIPRNEFIKMQFGGYLYE